MSRWTTVLVAALMLALLPRTRVPARAADTGKLRWWVTHPLVKVRPNDSVPERPETRARLYAARNEFEPFQIVLWTGSGGIDGVDVQISDLKGSSGAFIPARYAAVYLERYYEVTTPSSLDGGAGEWPDALLPRVDRYFGQKRNAFPFRLEPARNQPLWIELYIPPDAEPGDYSGEVAITAQGISRTAVPIELHVWRFTLPSTSSLPNSFGLNGPGVLKQHRGRGGDADLDEFTTLYAKAALLHRISVHGGTFAPPRVWGDGARMQLDWSRYDREVGPFLDGAVFAKGEPLPGARATSVDARIRSADADGKRIAYLKEWSRHFAEKGWLDRLFVYASDEPAPKMYGEVAAKARLSHESDRRIRNLVTASLDRALQGAVDIWTPLVNCMVGRPGFDDYCPKTVPREAYDGELRQGKILWWYQSCASHGCKMSTGEYFRGWPSYMIDVSPVANRMMEWLTWRYRVQGELYFNMDEAYAQDADPWNNMYQFGGNGDGTLFYPGRPREIGGTKDIPIESIRLKLIREGLEDYEYLNLLAGMGKREIADRAACRVAPTAYSWEHNPEVLLDSRRQIGELLDAEFRRAGQASTEAASKPSQQGGVSAANGTGIAAYGAAPDLPREFSSACTEKTE